MVESDWSVPLTYLETGHERNSQSRPTATFNNLFSWIDNIITPILRFIDRNAVHIGIKLHNVAQTELRSRRQFQDTNTNQIHVRIVWGTSSLVETQILRL